MILKGVIFDVDGTLADTEKQGHLWAFNQAFRLWDLPFRWTSQEYGALLKISGGKERLGYFLTRHPEYPQLSSNDIEEIYRIKTNLFKGRVRDGALPLRPGVRSLIIQCQKEEIAVGIATTTHYDNVEALLLRHFGPKWNDLLGVIVAGDEVSKKKPDPSVYLDCLDRLDVKADEAVAIEDSAIGLKAALRAGVRSIVTMNPWTYHQSFTGAMAVLTDLGTVGKPSYGKGPRGWGRYRISVDELRSW